MRLGEGSTHHHSNGLIHPPPQQWANESLCGGLLSVRMWRINCPISRSTASVLLQPMLAASPSSSELPGVVELPSAALRACTLMLASSAAASACWRLEVPAR